MATWLIKPKLEEIKLIWYFDGVQCAWYDTSTMTPEKAVGLRRYYKEQAKECSGMWEIQKNVTIEYGRWEIDT